MSQENFSESSCLIDSDAICMLYIAKAQPPFKMSLKGPLELGCVTRPCCYILLNSEIMINYWLLVNYHLSNSV